MNKTLLLLLSLALALAAQAQDCNLSFVGGSCSPNPCQVNSALTVQLQVQNSGELACSDVEFRFYLSLDSLLDGTDLLLGSSLANAAPGEMDTLICTVSPLSSVAGVTNRDYLALSENVTTNEVHVYSDILTIWPLFGTYQIGSGLGIFGNFHDHIDCYFENNTTYGIGYYLRDFTRRYDVNPHGHNGNMRSDIRTFLSRDASGSNVYGSERVKDINNLWIDSLSQAAAVDAHYYAGQVYDYFWHQLGRNSYDNGTSSMSTRLNSYVIYGSTQVTCWAACWTWFGSYSMVYYYQPGNNTSCSWMSGCIDIVAHEWAHGVTNFESELIYSGESGAINESFSDMMCISIGYWSGIDSDWLFGEDCILMRNIQNPPALIYSITGLPYPDTYLGPGWYTESSDNGGVHGNSSVANKMFYLLSEGGVHNGVAVDGIGIQNAMMLVYRANRDYWVSSTNFANAREGCIAAAQDLNPSYVPSVMDAWAAVGVGLPAPRPEAITDLAIHTTLDPQGISLNWSPAPGDVTYKIHASAAPGFIPDATTLIGSIADTSFSEPLSLSDGMRFYKVVVATP